jgi:hypothetical protein
MKKLFISFLCPFTLDGTAQTKEFVMKINVPYKLKKLGAIVAFGAAGLFMNGCDDKTEDIEKPVAPHETVYTFGEDANGQLSFTSIIPTDNIKKSADSVSVTKIIIRSNGTSLGGMASKILIEKVLEPGFEAAGAKGVGDGNLKDLSLMNLEDSIKLTGWGYILLQPIIQK